MTAAELTGRGGRATLKAGVSVGTGRAFGGRAALVGVLVAVALLATPAAVADRPVFNPSDITGVEATGPSGAVVTFSLSGSDDNGDPTINCDHSSGDTFPVGDTTVNCTATDTVTSETTPGSFDVQVVDTTDPTVTVPAPITAEATGPDGAAVSFSASASDTVSGSLTPSCSPSSGDTFPLGTTNVTCTATDGSGNQGSASFDVTVQDTTKPTVSVPGPISTEATGSAGAAVSFSATGDDLVDGTFDASCSPDSGSTFPIGTTTVSCTATDSHGNSSDAKTFTVTVHDTTPPDVTVPGPITAEATGPGGTPVSFSASASDIVDGSINPVCSPASGSTFALGTTNVACHATDGHGNTGNNSFTVTVRDTTPPALSGIPPDQKVEADGPSGSSVSFVPPVAVDLVDGPLRSSCDPPSGQLFPLGVTTVECTAKDSHGNTGEAGFGVTVVDTTKPALNVPGGISVSTGGADHIARSDSQVAAFLGAASARDIVDGPLPVTNDAPADLPLGKTVITFSATDRSGNTATGQSTLTVVTAGVPPQTIDRTPPHNVSRVKAKPGDRHVDLSWVPPATDFDHVTVSRTPGNALLKEIDVYRGKARHFRDKGLVDGTEYRYVVIAWDAAGNRSAGVVARATPKAALLVAPEDGAVVTEPPVCRWVPTVDAAYYNFQLYRLGTKTVSASSSMPGTKIQSTWPKRPQLALTKTWKYAGRIQRLTPGRYAWFVWPGFGAKSANHYGALIGQSQFVYRPKR